MDTSGYETLLVPILIEKRPFYLQQNIAKKFENDTWELPEMLRILKSDLEAKELGRTSNETSRSR